MVVSRIKSALTVANIGASIAICVSLWLVTLVLYDQFRLNFGGYDSVDGVVLESSIKSSLASRGSGGSRFVYMPVVKYRYKVGSTSYTGNSIESQHIRSSSRKKDGRVKDVVSKYPPGQKIEVWYDVNNHNVSVVNIENKMSLHKLFNILSFTLFGLLLIFLDRWYRAL